MAATIFFVARYALIYIFIYFTIYRFSFSLSVYAGILGGLGYFFLILYNNYFFGLPFSFVDPDGVVQTSSFIRTEGYLKAIYLITAGFVTGFIGLSIKKLVIKSITNEQENNKLITSNQIIKTVNEENKKYLDTIKDGLVLINPDLKILDQYSKSLLQIFEKDDSDKLTGMHIVDLIYPDKEEYKEGEGVQSFKPFFDKHVPYKVGSGTTTHLWTECQAYIRTVRK